MNFHEAARFRGRGPRHTPYLLFESSLSAVERTLISFLSYGWPQNHLKIFINPMISSSARISITKNKDSRQEINEIKLTMDDFKASRCVASVRSQIASQLGHGLSALIRSQTVAVQGINLYTGPAEDGSQRSKLVTNGHPANA